MSLTECPHCGGSLDVSDCDQCGESFPTEELSEYLGELYCDTCAERSVSGD